MKFSILAYFTALALFAVPGLCQDDVTPQGTIIDEDEVGFSEDNDIDVGKLLGDLLAGDQKDESLDSSWQSDDEGEKSEQNKEQDENNNMENLIATDKDAVANRNQFVDTFLTRLSDAIRQSHDPMKIIFKKSGKVVLRAEAKKVNRKAGVAKNKQKRKWRRRFQRRGNKGKKWRKERFPKSLAAGEEDKEQDEGKAEEKEGSVMSEEDLNDLTYEDENEDQQEGTADLDAEDDYFENELLQVNFVDDQETGLLDTKVDSEDDDYEDNETDLESLREGKDLGSVSEEEITVSSDGNTSRRVGKARRRRRRRRKGGRGKCGKVCRRRRRIRRRRRKNQKKQTAGNGQRAKRVGVKPTALLTGISRLRRSGDVRIKKEGQKEIIKADLEVGPIVLQAQKAFKVGPGKDIRKAEARTSVVKGKLVLALTPHGVTLKHLHLVRPKLIKVSGNLARKPGPSSGRFMRTYMTKTQPLIVHKMRKAANRVLRLSNGNAEFLNSAKA